MKKVHVRTTHPLSVKAATLMQPMGFRALLWHAQSATCTTLNSLRVAMIHAGFFTKSAAAPQLHCRLRVHRPCPRHRKFLPQLLHLCRLRIQQLSAPGTIFGREARVMIIIFFWEKIVCSWLVYQAPVVWM